MAGSCRTEASLRRQTAYHEAGHTVVAWAVDRPVGGICILENGDGASDIDVTTGRVEEIDRIAIAWAGMIAGNLCGEPRAAPDPWSTDRVEIYNAEARAHPNDEDAQRRLSAQGRAKARRLVREYWPLVDQLGAELYQRSTPYRRGSLSETEVRTMLANASNRDSSQSRTLVHLSAR